MDIKTWLEKNRYSQADLAGMIGVTQGAVSQWLLGNIKLSAERAIAIERATKGEVTREELRPDIFERAA